MLTFETIRTRLLGDLPATAYTATEIDSRNGPCLHIVPVNPRAAEVYIWLNGSCDVLFGRAFQVELGMDDEALLFEMGEAVLRGLLVEKIWSWRKTRHYTKSIIRLKERKFSCRSGFWLIYLPWWKKTYTYEAY